MNYVTEEEFKKRCDEQDEKLEDIKENHLRSIYDAQLWFNARLDEVEKKFSRNLALGLAIIAIFLAVIEVFG